MMALGDPQVQQGSSGNDVRALQEILATHRFSVGPIDGYFGTKTRAALIQFQETRGLTPDGVAGGETWKMLRQGPYIMQPSLGPMVPDAPTFASRTLAPSSIMLGLAVLGTMLFTGFFKK